MTVSNFWHTIFSVINGSNARRPAGPAKRRVGQRRIELLEARSLMAADATPAIAILTPPPAPPMEIWATEVDPGNEPRVTVLERNTNQKRSFLAFEQSFTGGVSVALGDVNGDGTNDIIVAAGQQGGPRVRVFNGINLQQLPGSIGNFFAYDTPFTGGVNLASADMNGDGKDDIITAADRDGGPHVRVWDAATGNEMWGFMAYGMAFTGGVRVAAGDVDGDGQADIITAAGPNGTHHVKVFSGAERQEISGPLGSFFAFDADANHGLYVAAADLNGDGRSEVIVSSGTQGGPETDGRPDGVVRVYSGSTGGLIEEFDLERNHRFYSGDLRTLEYRYGPKPGVRVRIADWNFDGQPDILIRDDRNHAGPTDYVVPSSSRPYSWAADAVLASDEFV